MAAPAGDPEQGSWARVTGALEQVVGFGRPAGTWTKYCCPIHEGDGGHHTPSLSVKYLADAKRTKVRCQAGCDDELVLEAIGLTVRDLYDTPIQRGTGRARPLARPTVRQESRSDRALRAAGIPAKKPKRELGEQLSPWKATDTYTYVRADGTVAGEVIRKEAEFEGGRDKAFSQRAWNPAHNGWEHTGFDKIPFRAPEVRNAIEAGRTIYLVEGEKDAINAANAGLVATTNAGGASAWSPEHAEHLRGARTVVIVADVDAPGYHRADRVMATLDGLVERVRVVRAAEGKDLTDHLGAGHRVADLVPIPHLDPYTRALAAVPDHQAAPGPAPPVAVAPDVEFEPPPDPETHSTAVPPEGDLPMPGESLLQHFDSPSIGHSDEVDHIHREWSAFSKLLMQQMLLMATKVAEQRAAAALYHANEDHKNRVAEQQRLAAERAAIETRLRKLREAGYGKASRTELAFALADAATWADSSKVASSEMGHLTHHIRDRFGIAINPGTGEVGVDGDAALADLLAAEQARVEAARTRKTQDHMISVVAAEIDLDESAKAELYAAIQSWRTDPTPAQLAELTRKLKEKKASEQGQAKIRFVATYFGAPAVIGDEELDNPATVTAAEELARAPRPLVDPGEEAKPRIDRLLETYQEQLRVGAPTNKVREELAREVAVLTPEDQDAARARGKAIRANPAKMYPRMWPSHVDRDELGEHLHAYAKLAPAAEHAAVEADSFTAADAAALRRQAAGHRTAIKEALTNGEGLHSLEKDQIKAVLDDIEAGKTQLPEQLFADDRSVATVDIARSERIAYTAERTQRRDLEQILEAGGVSQEVRARVGDHLDRTSGVARAAHRSGADTTRKWADRREAVVIARAADAVDYDSPQRQQQLAAKLRAAGLDEDQVAERVAADASFATPPAAAAQAPKRGPRTTSPGDGMRYGHNRNGKDKGKGGPDQGL
ncbi:toprim domain-containing protein [Nocardia bovistercoris]|uniref:Toprim domain-containing protein n=1 Tax=Nocardia bovistercoris TaxID=2785916 RepID=A0A931IGV6_9NOCA|nr:toprim domain-containing protein [Nocardia bovistercoris]MBH0780343.1 hypothetical protein [Nocardia bovistercoris]